MLIWEKMYDVDISVMSNIVITMDIIVWVHLLIGVLHCSMV